MTNTKTIYQNLNSLLGAFEWQRQHTNRTIKFQEYGITIWQVNIIWILIYIFHNSIRKNCIKKICYGVIFWMFISMLCECLAIIIFTFQIYHVFMFYSQTEGFCASIRFGFRIQLKNYEHRKHWNINPVHLSEQFWRRSDPTHFASHEEVYIISHFYCHLLFVALFCELHVLPTSYTSV